VLLVCFLRGGLIGGLKRAAASLRKRHSVRSPPQATASRELRSLTSIGPSRRRQEMPRLGPALETRALSKAFGGLVANKNINFSVEPGELRGIIGPNGAGKSTFFKMLTCEIRPTSGRIILHGRDITGGNVAAVCQLGLTKTYQVNQLFDRLTPRENITIAALAERRGTFSLDLLRATPHVPGLEAQVETTLAMIGLAAGTDVPVAELPYGDKRRLELGLALATQPSVLLLDEPLAGMSPRERKEAVQLLQNIRRGRTLVIVEHDMDAVFELAERITVLHEGTLLAEGSPAEIQRNSKVQEAYLGGLAAA
jgi:branched-chain amino acid transport system permease protein